MDAQARILELQRKVEQLERENKLLRGEKTPQIPQQSVETLSKDHIERYSRQLLLADGFGVEGQLKLLNSSVIIVGAGGIGSTLSLYLAAAGVGRLAIVDGDTIESSNLHRQVIHKEHLVGTLKAESARNAVLDLNPTIVCEAICETLTHANAMQLFREYDCVVDASDNPKTRYLINDACVLLNKTLVSGSAVGTEGQLSVYNYQDGPCYRCLYPEAVTIGCNSCSDAGVLGPVPGLIGILQSMETIKVLTGVGQVMSDRFLMYDSLRCGFHNMKKPKKSPSCPVCSPNAKIRSMEDSKEDLLHSRGPVGGACVLPPPADLPEGVEISCEDYVQLRESMDHLLLDVRVTRQFDMCTLEGAVNIPVSQLKDRIQDVKDKNLPIYCLCRRGIASAKAARILLDEGIPNVHHIRGGLTAWNANIDRDFPKY